jgi:DNA-binding transcriptional MerR regulator
MTLSALRKFILPPLMTSACVFAAVTAPIFVMGSKQIDIKLDQEPFLSGKVREVAFPYVAAATAITVGAGLSVAAFSGWRNSAKKSSEIEEQISNLERQIQEKEELLKELKLSEGRLQISGLQAFLEEEEASFANVSHQKSFAAAVSQPVVMETPVKVYEPPSNKVASKVAVAQHTTTINKTSTKASSVAASSFSPAQAFLAYNQANNNSRKENSVPNVIENKTSTTPTELDQMQQQLREMMSQMQAMQTTLQHMPQTAQTDVKASEQFQVYYDSPKTDEVKYL